MLISSEPPRFSQTRLLAHLLTDQFPLIGPSPDWSSSRDPQWVFLQQSVSFSLTAALVHHCFDLRANRTSVDSVSKTMDMRLNHLCSSRSSVKERKENTQTDNLLSPRQGQSPQWTHLPSLSRNLEKPRSWEPLWAKRRKQDVLGNQRSSTFMSEILPQGAKVTTILDRLNLHHATSSGRRRPQGRTCSDAHTPYVRVTDLLSPVQLPGTHCQGHRCSR